jgi:hypothetical protein
VANPGCSFLVSVKEYSAARQLLSTKTIPEKKQFMKRLFLFLTIVLGAQFSRAQVVTAYDATTAGACNGMAYASYTGLIQQWSWLDDQGASIQSGGDTLYNLCAGDYSLSYIDSTGDTLFQNFTIGIDPCAYMAVATSWSDDPNGTCSGSMLAMGTNGTAPYAYLWSNGITTADQLNVCAGVYSVVATDMNGCTGSAQVTITGAPPCDSFQVFINGFPSTEPGLCNGSATAVVFGGTSPYAFTWSNGAVTQTISGLCDGWYSITVTDANGCVAGYQDSIAPVPCDGFGLGFDADNASAPGVCDGSISLGGIAGTTIVDYLWNTGETTATIDQLCAGLYTVVMHDQDGCENTASFQIGIDSLIIPLTGYVGSTNTTSGNCDGTAWPMVYGGTAPYTYIWPDGSAGTSADSLCEGIYLLTVLDANYDSTFITFVIADSAAIIQNYTFQDSLVIDTLFANVVELCDISLSEVTTAYIDSWTLSSPDSVTVFWALETDSSGTIYVEMTYALNNPQNGVFSVELAVYCPQKSGAQFMKAYDQILIEGLSVDEQEAADVVAYPNPFAETLKLDLPHAGRYTFTLTDAAGRIVRTETSQAETHYELNDLGTLAAGHYLLQVSNEGYRSVVRVVK